LDRSVGARRDLADLSDIFAVERELQKLAVGVGVAADPDKPAIIDLDAVLAPDPFIARAGAAPRPQQIALDVELQHRRCRHAALSAWRIQRRIFFGIIERARALDHPDMALPIDGDAADLSHDPVVGQLLRPGRIHRESRDFAGGSRAGQEAERRRGGAKGDGFGETSDGAGAMVRRRHEFLPRFSCGLCRLGVQSIAGRERSQFIARAPDAAQRAISAFTRVFDALRC